MDRYTLRTLIGWDLTLGHFAWLTVGASVALSLIGVYAIDVGTRLPDSGEAMSGLVVRQLVFLAVGLLAAGLVAFPHYRLIRMVAWPVMWVTLGLLLFLLIPVVPSWLVTPRNGARAWINLGPVDFQPSEVCKIAFVLVVSDYLRYRSSHRTLTGLLPIALITFVPVGLIMLQPDFGTAAIFIPTLFAILLAAGAKIKHLVAVVLIGAAAVPAAYPLLKPYQKQRILGLVMVMKGDREAANDTTYQSFTAITLTGAGGVSGLEDEQSRAMVRFNRLPERHNDMVFAVVVNRFGLLGGVAVLGLYLVWFAGALATAAISRDPFGRLVVVGCTAAVAAQMFINVGMNIGLVPIVGLTLPYVSYGGSSMLTVWIMTGLIFSVATRRPARMSRPTFEWDRVERD
ncbi:MAG: rod shape-determining protein RodA [Phycisphaeraceae bacterium]|nr:rod shape-determining protein RodA [Phycisphaeraceae bacterium]